ADVARDGGGEQEGVLLRVTDARAHRREREIAHVGAVDEHRAVRRRQETREERGDGALARSGASDAKTEAAILEAIDRQAANRTVVLVTHRIAAASRCDRIVVLDGGKIIDEGTHEELVSREGLYKSFADEQSAKTALEEIE